MFFLKNQTSVKNAINDIESFSDFSELCPNLDKCEIAGIEVLKNLNVALCSMKKFWEYKFLIIRKLKMI